MPAGACLLALNWGSACRSIVVLSVRGDRHESTSPPLLIMAGRGGADTANVPPTMRFNAPPGWDTPSDPAWTPPTGWAPQPWWPPAPDNWSFWVPEAPPPVSEHAPVEHAPTSIAGRAPVTPTPPPATAYPTSPQRFWTLRMSRHSAIAIGVLLVMFSAVMISQAYEARADRIESGVDLCTQAVREELAARSDYVTLDFPIDYSTAVIDGDMVVRTSGGAFVGRGAHYGYACEITHTGQWPERSGFSVPLVLISDG